MLDTALTVSQLDAGMLADVSVRLEEKCGRNKYGLSEEACVQAVRARSGICVEETSGKYPGAIGNSEHMLIVVKHHVDCIFRQP